MGSSPVGWVLRSSAGRQVSLDRDQVAIEIRESLLEEAVDGRQIDLRVQVNDPVAEACHPPKVVRLPRNASSEIRPRSRRSLTYPRMREIASVNIPA